MNSSHSEALLFDGSGVLSGFPGCGKDFEKALLALESQYQC